MSNTPSPEKEQTARPKSLVDALRQAPARKSKIGGILTRQPDYEQRHLEMMRYLASLRNGGKDAASAVFNSSSTSHAPGFAPANPEDGGTSTGSTNSDVNGGEKLFMGSAYKEEALHRYHETEVHRLRSSLDGRRRFKNTATLYSTIKPSSSSSGSVGKEEEEELYYDPATGLPRTHLATMGLKQSAAGISPWRVLFHWARQSIFGSGTAALILILGFVVLLNFRRFAVLLQPIAASPAAAGLSAAGEAAMKVE